MKIKIGNKIKSYDFEPCVGRGENYMEGIVWKIDDTFIWFNPTRIVRDGKPYLPKEGNLDKYENTTRTITNGNTFEYDGRLTILNEVK